MTDQQIGEMWYAMARAKDMSMKKRKWWHRRSPLEKFLHDLASYPHTYNTICYAVTAAALAAARAMNRTPGGGISGFQASAIMWEFIGEWMLTYKGKQLRMVDFHDLLYPQYAEHFLTIPQSVWERTQKHAAQYLQECPGVSEQVRAHWQSIVDGNIPFGLGLSEQGEVDKSEAPHG